MKEKWYPSIRELPEMEKPYEKCEHFGPEALSDAELLSVILRTGARGMSALEMSREILACPGCEGLAGLHRICEQDLMQIRGMGRVKSLQVRCIAELSRRISRASIGPEDGLNFQDPQTIAQYYMEDLRHETQEIVLLLCLSSKGSLLRKEVISRGTVNSAVITPREIFAAALKYRAASVILLHNHPSGDPTPSREDITFTGMVRRAGALIGITLLDHIVVGDMCYVSLRQEGLMKEDGRQEAC